MAGPQLELGPPQLLLLCALWSAPPGSCPAEPWLPLEDSASRGWSSRMVGGPSSFRDAFSMEASGADSAYDSPMQNQCSSTFGGRWSCPLDRQDLHAHDAGLHLMQLPVRIWHRAKWSLSAR